MTTLNPENLGYNIDALRSQDEAIDDPNKQTLNFSRVLNFLRENGITVNNWDKDFTIDASLKLLNSANNTDTEKMLFTKLSEAKAVLTKYNRLDIFGEKNDSVIDQQINNLKTPPNNMTQGEATKVIQGWNYFNVIRVHAMRLLRVEESGRLSREREFVSRPGVTETITSTVQDKLGTARENWDKLEGKQKLLMAGVALIGGIMFFNSKNVIIGKIKETLTTGAKALGAAWLFDKVWYLFTGEGVIDTVTGTTSEGHKKSPFLKEAFNTTEQGAGIMSKAMVLMGEFNFNDLTARYEEAIADGSRTIEGTRMPPNEAFQAMEIFFNKYPLNRVKAEYSKYNPPIAFNQVITIELARDPHVKLEEALTTRVADSITDNFKKGYNYLASSAATTWLGEKFKLWKGREATKEDLDDFVKSFQHVVKNESEFLTAINGPVVKDNVIAKQFVEANQKGLTDSSHGLKYLKGNDGHIYMIASKSLDEMSKVSGFSDVLQKCVNDSELFLQEKYQISPADSASKTTPYGSVFVTDSNTVKYLVRY